MSSTRFEITSVAPLAVIALALVFALVPARALAQELQPGTRIRVTQANGFKSQGTLQGIDADSARLAGTRGNPMAVSLTDVTKIEVSMGRQRQFWRNFGMTTGGLVLLGGVAGAASYEPCNPDELFDCLFEPESRGEATAIGGVAGAIVGIPLGILVGAVVQQEVWAPVNHQMMNARRVSIRPTFRRGVGFAAAVTLE